MESHWASRKLMESMKCFRKLNLEVLSSVQSLEVEKSKDCNVLGQNKGARSNVTSTENGGNSGLENGEPWIAQS